MGKRSWLNPRGVLDRYSAFSTFSFVPCARLLGREIDVDLNAGIFVTLNPAGKKYGGRSKLPDNLKALFRPVAMGRPDNELIAEV